MDTLEAIEMRRSVRKYLDRPVEFEKLTTILDCARKAPSAGNLQTWRFVMVTEKNLIAQVATYSVEQYWIATAPVLILVCTVPEKQELYYGLRGKRLYAVQDCAAAIQNLMLAATDMGLGTCWIGAFEEDKIRSLFEIPPDVRPQAIITLGYPDEVLEPRVLDPLENQVYFNRWGMRVEKLHIVLRDYAVEWQKQHGAVKRAFNTTGRKLREEFGRWREKIRKKKK